MLGATGTALLLTPKVSVGAPPLRLESKWREDPLPLVRPMPEYPRSIHSCTAAAGMVHVTSSPVWNVPLGLVTPTTGTSPGWLFQVMVSALHGALALARAAPVRNV